MPSNRIYQFILEFAQLIVPYLGIRYPSESVLLLQHKNTEIPTIITLHLSQQTLQYHGKLTIMKSYKKQGGFGLCREE